PNSAITAHMNCISGNSVAGLEEDTGGYTPVTPGSLDATENWWGSPSGPTIASNPGGTGDKIIDQDGVVSYNPWTKIQPDAPCPLAFTKLASGSFAIGDQNATVGSNVEWWGSNWSKVNSLSGGPAPAAFKGFAESLSGSPMCGETWTTKAGKSSHPPATVPEVMEVIASSKITKSGSTISGDVREVTLVKTNPGYRPSPGHKGTGK